MLGKLVVEGRHPSPVGTVLELLGAAVGYGAARWYVHNRRPGWLEGPA